MYVTDDFGYFEIDKIEIEYTGDGSELSCQIEILETKNNKVTGLRLKGHARSKKGYNAAAGWVDCKARIPYFNGGFPLESR